MEGCRSLHPESGWLTREGIDVFEPAGSRGSIYLYKSIFIGYQFPSKLHRYLRTAFIYQPLENP
jgi:hypothetical protein